MLHKITLSLIAGIVPLLCFAQLSLTIEIGDLRNNKGQVHLELMNEHEEIVAAQSRNIADNTCIIRIDGLNAGRYTFKFFHDENNNKELDTNWLGIPREGFGFSNNPGIVFGPPSAEKILFELKETTVLQCTPKYF